MTIGRGAPSRGAAERFQATNIWMVGNTIAHWDGSAWNVTPDAGPDEPGGASEVWANAPDDVWIAAYAPMSTELRHFDGIAWRTVRSFFREVLWDLWSPGPDELYVGGDTVRHYRAGTWIDTGGPGATSLWGIAGVELWGAAGYGTLVRKTLR